MRKLHQIFENHYIVMISNVVKRSKYKIARSATLNADDAGYFTAQAKGGGIAPPPPPWDRNLWKSVSVRL